MLRILLVLSILFVFPNFARAENTEAESQVDPRMVYAADKLVNAQAQLDKLKAQKKAIDAMIKAVKRDLKAAKIRAKAEKIQEVADVNRKDAEFMIEKSGVALELPNLLIEEGQGELIEETTGELTASQAAEKQVEKMFPEEEFEKVDSVFFPGNDVKEPSKSSNKKISDDVNLPYYIK